MTIEYRSAPLTPGNLKAARITITPFRHLLPADAIGSHRREEPAANRLVLHWRHHRTETDIPSYQDGRPREFFRDRAFSRLVFEDGGASPGDVIVFERLGPNEFRLRLERPDGSRVS